MRSLLPYRCVACGAELGSAFACASCGGEARDLAGQPPVAGASAVVRPLARWPWLLAPAPVGVVALTVALRGDPAIDALRWALYLLGGLVAGALLSLALGWPGLSTWRGDRRRLGLARARRARAGAMLAIADTRTGPEARVRGRVRVLRSVAAPSGVAVAAYRDRRAEGGALVETQACGRFLLDDGSGLAMIDEDAFELSPLDRGRISARRASTLALVDGDLVEVLGAARVEAPPADVPRAPDRADATVLVFDGSADAPLLLLPLPPGAALASPKLFGGTSSPHEGLITRERQALGELEAGGRAEAEERGRFTR